MGMGDCQKVEYTNAGVRALLHAQENGTKPVLGRRHCTSFYWDVTSIFLKTTCLSLFFLVEAPRRVVSYARRKPEPTPFFTCSKWGYRMCACGHHYYDHADIKEHTPIFIPRTKPAEQQQLLTNDSQKQKPFRVVRTESESPQASSSDHSISISQPAKKRRRRRWYWPF